MFERSSRVPQGQTAFDVADEDVLGYLEELQKKQNLVSQCTEHAPPSVVHLVYGQDVEQKEGFFDCPLDLVLVFRVDLW